MPLSLVERGGLGAMAGIGGSLACHPFDVLRVQMQLGSSTDGISTTVKRIVKSEGGE